MLVSVLGSVTLVKLVQPLKAESPIVEDNPLLSVTVVRAVQL